MLLQQARQRDLEEVQKKLERLQEVRIWEEQRNHLCNLIAWQSVTEQQGLIDECDHILNGSAKEKMETVSTT